MIRNAHKRVEKFAVEPVFYPPSISVTLPFEARLKSKKHIEDSFKRILEKVEKDLVERFSKVYVKPAVAKLKAILNNLNFNTESRSVAVFLSPYAEKVLYLNMAIKERVFIGDSYSVRDLLQLKKEETGLLLLVLNNTHSNLYLKSGTRPTLLLSNPAIPAIAEKATGTALERQNAYLNYKCRQIDLGLSLILKTHSLPLLVVGEENRLKSFIKVTKNVEHIVQFIPQSIGTITLKEVQSCIQKQEADWKKLKMKSILLQLEHAVSNGKLAAGIEDVWTCSKKRKTKLLVVERSYAYPVYLDENEKIIYANGSISDADKIKDAVEDAIEHVLEDGGQIEIVEDGDLKDYMHMALIIK